MEDIYEMMMNETVDYRAVYKDGINIGYERGKSEGITQGYSDGIATNSRNIAKNMLKENVDVSLISKYTNLSIPEIKALR